MLTTGKRITSPGGSFLYEIQGPVCVLYDRNELPWPSCSLQWKGLQPSWNRQGRRFVPDITASKCPSYQVTAEDTSGCRWQQVLTLYSTRLNRNEKDWWYWRYKPNQAPPDHVSL